MTYPFKKLLIASVFLSEEDTRAYAVDSLDVVVVAIHVDPDGRCDPGNMAFFTPAEARIFASRMVDAANKAEQYK